MSDAESTPEQAPPKPPNTVTLTIDGTEVTVAKGTNVLEAAKTIGTDISAFCYHPGLSIAACCRQCLVSIEGQGKLQPSCQMRAGDGMVVHTADERSSTARRQQLEFTLLNHPIDCPICDKAGECTLQKLYFEHDNRPSRVDVPKVHKPKVVDLGPEIVLDAERCILCTRCIRVCDEVAGVHQLEMAYRGDHETLGTAPGAQLDNPYSLNTVDVCPVGALTAKDFRFTMRAWELMMTPSVCPGCATGCNMEIHHKNDRAWRLYPRHNPDVNKYWMCDEGRETYHDLREDRIATPLVGGLPSSWENALRYAADKLLPVLEDFSTSFGVVFSATNSNEDNYALAKLARDVWQLDRFYVSGEAPEPERADDILRDADVNPNTFGVNAIARDPASLEVLDQNLQDGELKALLVLGHELDLSDEGMARLGELDALVTITWQETDVVAAADVAFPCTAWAEEHGTITNRQGMVQRYHAALSPPGHALPGWQVVSRLARACGAAVELTHVKKVFTEMTAKVEQFKDADWGREVRPVQLRFAASRG